VKKPCIDCGQLMLRPMHPEHVKGVYCRVFRWCSEVAQLGMVPMDWSVWCMIARQAGESKRYSKRSWEKMLGHDMSELQMDEEQRFDAITFKLAMGTLRRDLPKERMMSCSHFDKGRMQCGRMMALRAVDLLDSDVYRKFPAATALIDECVAAVALCEGRGNDGREESEWWFALASVIGFDREQGQDYYYDSSLRIYLRSTLELAERNRL